MGDRGNIVILQSQPDQKIYLYTHWERSRLPEILARALSRGEDRWDDEAYVARIVFSEMIRNDLDGVTGYGISSYLQDGDETLIVDCKRKTVNGVPFREFVNANPGR